LCWTCRNCRRRWRFDSHARARRRSYRCCRSRRTHPRSLGSGFLCSGLRFRCSFGSSLGLCLTQNLFADFLRDIFRDRARVRLLLGHAIPGQKINNRLRLDLEFAGQLINSNLVCFDHASYRPFHGQNTQPALFRPGYLLLKVSALPLPSSRYQDVL
jgi:hypothetical protein